MTLTVHLFARARDLAGADRVAVQLPEGATVGDLRQQLARTYPRLSALLGRSSIAVCDEFAPDSVALAPEAEVAVLPPVSGG
jgi:molybdopterin converting factor subunit 1